MTLVFDASALIALLKDEPGAAPTETILTDGSTTRFAHAVNLCEVYYHFVKLGDEARVAAELAAFARGGLETRQDMDQTFWQAVARMKAELQHASLTDCFAVALSQRVGGTIITADHPSFDPVAPRSICPVTFIR